MQKEVEITETQTTHAGLQNNITGQINADEVTVNDSLVGLMQAGGDITIADSAILVAGASGSLTMRNGVAIIIDSAGDLTIEKGGAVNIQAGGNMTIKDGGGALLRCNQATLESGMVGVVLARQVLVDKDAQVLLNTPQAIALGLAFGAGFAIVLGGFLAILKLLFRLKRR
jgi:hypothetical protein